MEACQRRVSGEEDRPHRREGPRDFQAYLGRGLRGLGSGRDPGSPRLDGRHRPARPAAVRPAGGRHVRLGQESDKCGVARYCFVCLYHDLDTLINSNLQNCVQPNVFCFPVWIHCNYKNGVKFGESNFLFWQNEALN